MSTADAGVIEKTYLELRPQVIRAISAAKGSGADGAVFYRVAFIHMARLAHAGNIPDNITLPVFLEQLALLHFRDWLVLREPDTLLEEAGNPDEMPSPENRLDLRRSVWARRQFFRLHKQDRYRIQELADDAAQLPEDRRLQTEEELVSEGYAEHIGHYKELLKDPSSNWNGLFLPGWVVTALSDQHFTTVWDQTQFLEQRLAGDTDTAPKRNHFWRNALIGVALLTVIVAAVQWFTRSDSPAEVYQENFSAPESLLSDLAARQAASPDIDSLGARPEACALAFSDADAAYQSKDYRNAAAALASILDDANKPCHSDAYFYLAIVGLHLNEPELTIECLSNIEDLSRYGEDIYWYQALAFVKMATQNPMVKERAQRAVERVMSNTELPERREQAGEMLKQLND